MTVTAYPPAQQSVHYTFDNVQYRYAVLLISQKNEESQAAQVHPARQNSPELV